MGSNALKKPFGNGAEGHGGGLGNEITNRDHPNWGESATLNRFCSKSGGSQTKRGKTPGKYLRTGRKTTGRNYFLKQRDAPS